MRRFLAVVSVQPWGNIGKRRVKRLPAGHTTSFDLLMRPLGSTLSHGAIVFTKKNAGAETSLLRERVVVGGKEDSNRR